MYIYDHLCIPVCIYVHLLISIDLYLSLSLSISISTAGDTSRTWFNQESAPEAKLGKVSSARLCNWESLSRNIMVFEASKRTGVFFLQRTDYPFLLPQDWIHWFFLSCQGSLDLSMQAKHVLAITRSASSKNKKCRLANRKNQQT